MPRCTQMPTVRCALVMTSARCVWFGLRLAPPACRPRRSRLTVSFGFVKSTSHQSRYMSAGGRIRIEASPSSTVVQGLRFLRYLLEVLIPHGQTFEKQRCGEVLDCAETCRVAAASHKAGLPDHDRETAVVSARLLRTYRSTAGSVLQIRHTDAGDKWQRSPSMQDNHDAGEDPGFYAFLAPR